MEEKSIDKELINGQLYEIEPKTEREIEIAKNLKRLFEDYKLAHKPLDTGFSEFVEINLPEINSIIQPMFAVKKNDSENTLDWVVDFTTSNDNVLDFLIKPIFFKQANVSEYWIINTKTSQIIIYNFDKNGFIQTNIEIPRRIKVGIYPNFIINYSDIFA